MTQVLAFLKNPIVAAISAVTVVLLWAMLFYGPAQFRDGVENEKAAAYALAQKLINKMEENNEELKNLDVNDLCVELGGLPEDCTN